MKLRLSLPAGNLMLPDGKDTSTGGFTKVADCWEVRFRRGLGGSFKPGSEDTLPSATLFVSISLRNIHTRIRTFLDYQEKRGLCNGAQN
jgi:hypothetical protein